MRMIGGDAGEWRIERILPVIGRGLPGCARLSQVEDGEARAGAFCLEGVRTHERYVEHAEHERLAAVQPQLSRPDSSRAVLIPLSKSEEWWELAQDERRHILATRSRHIEEGLRRLPAIARRLYHGREIGAEFDFLTWFEFAPDAEPAFDELLAHLRASDEWRFVVREVEVRLLRSSS